jgi:hypothetical protein
VGMDPGASVLICGIVWVVACAVVLWQAGASVGDQPEAPGVRHRTLL